MQTKGITYWRPPRGFTLAFLMALGVAGFSVAFVMLVGWMGWMPR